MLMIRLQKIGKKKNPTYRLVVSEKNKDTQSGSLENLGTYNSVSSNKLIDFKKDRILYWLSVGAQASASVNNLLVEQGIIKADKQKSVSITKRRQEKMGKKKAEAASVKAEAEKKATENKLAEEEAKKQAAEAEKAEAEKKAVEEEAVKQASQETAPASETPVEAEKVGEAPVAEEKSAE